MHERRHTEVFVIYVYLILCLPVNLHVCLVSRNPLSKPSIFYKAVLDSDFVVICSTPSKSVATPNETRSPPPSAGRARRLRGHPPDSRKGETRKRRRGQAPKDPDRTRARSFLIHPFFLPLWEGRRAGVGGRVNEGPRGVHPTPICVSLTPGTHKP